MNGNLSSLPLNVGCELSRLHHHKIVDRVLSDDVSHMLRRLLLRSSVALLLFELDLRLAIQRSSVLLVAIRSSQILHDKIIVSGEHITISLLLVVKIDCTARSINCCLLRSAHSELLVCFGRRNLLALGYKVHR